MDAQAVPKNVKFFPLRFSANRGKILHGLVREPDFQLLAESYDDGEMAGDDDRPRKKRVSSQI